MTEAPPPAAPPQKVGNHDVWLGFALYVLLIVLSLTFLFVWGPASGDFSFASTLLAYAVPTAALGILVWALVKKRYGIIVGAALALGVIVLLVTACAFIVIQSFN